MKIKLILLLTFLIITVISLTRLGYIFNNKYESLYDSYKEELKLTFHQAVLAETQKRLIEYKIPFIRISNPSKKRSEYASSTTISGTVYFKRTEEYERLSTEEKENLFLQTGLIEIGAKLDVNWLNQIWQEKLKETRITDLETGVKYRQRDLAETIYSDKDSLFFVNSSRIDWYVTGMYKEIDLQGHYNFSFKSLYQYAKKDFLILIFLGGILILNLIICAILILQIKQLKVRTFNKLIKEKEYIVVCNGNSGSYGIVHVLFFVVSINSSTCFN